MTNIVLRFDASDFMQGLMESVLPVVAGDVYKKNYNYQICQINQIGH